MKNPEIIKIQAVYKRLFLLSILLFFVKTQNAQTIAPFKIRLTNGIGFTYNDLKKDVATVLVYFEPGCIHCNAFVKALMKRKDQNGRRQIVFITYVSINEAIKFDQLFKISSNSSFKIGSEGYSFIVQKYYNIQKLPFIALYNKQQQLIKILSPEEEPDVLAKEIISFK